MLKYLLVIFVYLFSLNLSAEILSFQEWKSGKIRSAKSYLNAKSFELKKTRNKKLKRSVASELGQAKKNYRYFKSLTVADYYKLYLRNQKALSSKDANYLSKKMSKRQLALLLQAYQEQSISGEGQAFPNL